MLNSNQTNRLWIWACTAAGFIACVCVPTVLCAQSTPVAITRSVIASGGTFRSMNAEAALSGTIGQSLIGVVSDDIDVLYQGFWTPPFSVSSVPGDQVAAGSGAFHLANSPNPFQLSTEITFQLQSRSHVDLAIFDMAGIEVVRLASETRDAGEHRMQWDGLNARGERASGGMYTCMLTVTRPDGDQSALVRRDRVKLMLVR